MSIGSGISAGLNVAVSATQPAVEDLRSGEAKLASDIAQLKTAVANLQTNQNSIQAGSIGGVQIANGTITATQIGVGAIQAGNIGANQITSAQIAANTITAGQIAANSITAGQIAANTITSAQIAAGSITATTIASGSITATQIATGTITATQIQGGTITSTQIQAGSINGTSIAGGTITAGLLAANSVTAGTIAAGAITSSTLGTGIINTNNIASGAITAALITVSNLQAVSSTMGTVTGGIFQTQTSGSRVLMGSTISTSSGTYSGVIGVDASQNITFLLDASTGNVSLTGTLMQGSSGLGNIAGVTQNVPLMQGSTNIAPNPDANTTSPLGWAVSNGTVAQSSAQALLPSYAFKWTTSAGGSLNFYSYSTIGYAPKPTPPATFPAMNSYGQYGVLLSNFGTPVTGNPYSAMFWVYNASASSRVFYGSLAFINAAGSVLGTPTAGSNVVIPPNQWTRVYVEGVAMPSGAVYCQPTLTSSAAQSGDVYYIDQIVFTPNSSAQGSTVVAASITAASIQAGSITATEINVSRLDALTANLGNITTGTLTGVTITGSTLQTAISGQRIVINAAGMFAYNSSGVQTLYWDGRGNEYIYQASGYNSRYYLDSNNATAGYLQALIGTSANVNGGATTENVMTLEAVASSASPAARAQLIGAAASSGGYAQLGVEYSDSYGDYIYVAMNTGNKLYANILTSSNTSSFIRDGGNGGNPTAQYDGIKRIWALLAVGASIPAGSPGTQGYTFSWGGLNFPSCSGYVGNINGQEGQYIDQCRIAMTNTSGGSMYFLGTNPSGQTATGAWAVTLVTDGY